MAKIMIVDDSAADLRLMSDILSSNYSVTAINDPLVAAMQAATERPDLIFLDVVMPERNGYEVLRALKRQDETKATKVVFVSSKGSATDVKWGLRQGATDYLIKPYTAAQVLGVIQKHLTNV